MIEIDRDAIDRAALAVEAAEALLIGAGAGMGVDSGMPDFRGPGGFWRAYPPYEKLGLRFEAIANPAHFATDPPLAWGFYGHRLNLYRRLSPHPGFAILKGWVEGKERGGFVFTSNVDHHFQKAGFDPDRVVECHGSIEHRQCFHGCDAGIFDADPAEIVVDPSTFRAAGSLPTCPGCGRLARPNILMFGDWGWDSSRTAEQRTRCGRWLEELGSKKLAVIEIGAGLAIPTVRQTCQDVANQFGAPLIRINPREPQVPPGQTGIAMGALDGLRAIAGRIQGSRGVGLDER